MIRTLIVDDDFRVARLHRAYVEKVPGFTVVGEAGTGTEALRLVATTRPDLLLLDIYLPDISGLEVLRTIRETGTPRVDVIAITAARDVQSLRSAMQGGVVHYLIKPFRFAALQEKLQSYAAMRQRLAQLPEADQHAVDTLYHILRHGSAETLRTLRRPGSAGGARRRFELCHINRARGGIAAPHLRRLDRDQSQSAAACGRAAKWAGGTSDGAGVSCGRRPGGDVAFATHGTLG